MVSAAALRAGSAQAEERKDNENDHDEADDVNDAVHGVLRAMRTLCAGVPLVDPGRQRGANGKGSG